LAHNTDANESCARKQKMANEAQPEQHAQAANARASISALFLADRAEVSQNKLYVMGGAIDMVQAPSVPALIQIGIAIIITVPWNATNEPHQVLFRIDDADGQQVASINLGFNTGRPPWLGRGDDQHVPFALPQIALPIKAFGGYVLHATLDELPGPRWTFRVRPLGAAGAAPQQPD
jgi:hypothetical protein